MQAHIRLGIIGLGRRWQRYRIALAQLSKHVQIRAVCDQVGQRAETVARQLRCAAAGGAIDLIERDDVDAVLLLDRQWFGLWPLEQASRQGKPVFCATSLTAESPYADRLHALLQESGVRVMMALLPCAAPSFGRLSEVLQQRLGPARFVRADAILPARTARMRGEQLLRSGLALSLFHACRTLIGDSPLNSVTHLPEASSFASAALEFEQGRVALITLAAGVAGRSSCRFEVRGEKGAAVASGPGCVRWSDSEGYHSHRLAMPSLHQYLLERFVQALRTGGPSRPSFDEAYQGLLWQRAALRGRPGSGEFGQEPDKEE
jgi:predicted dehydrogenase